jgi:CubicO group peptidase (beta-lactamase class C family)
MDFYDIGELRDCYNIDTNFLVNSMGKQLKRASACTMSIIHGGNAYVRAIGRLNLDDEAENCNIHSKFHISSLTKLFTGYLVEKLVEEGRILYESTLDELCSEEICSKLQLSPKTTINMLVSHQSGLLNAKISFYSKDYSESLETFVSEKLPAVDVVNEGIGTFYYSDVGMNLVGYICEQVTGRDFPSLIREYILAPLDLTETGFFDENIRENLCEGVCVENGKVVQLPNIVSNPSFFPSTLMYSSICDMSKFIQHIMEEYDNMSRLFQAQVSFGELSFYCRTWVYQRYWHKNIYFHNASDTGAFGRVYMVPSEKCAFIFLSNSESMGYAERVTHYFLNKIKLNSPPDKELVQEKIGKRNKELQFGKEYLSRDGKPKKLAFKKEGEKLLVRIADGTGKEADGVVDSAENIIRFEDGHYEIFEIVSAKYGKADLISFDKAFYECIDNYLQIDRNISLFMDNLGTYRGCLAEDSQKRIVKLEYDECGGMLINLGDSKIRILPFPNKYNVFITPLGKMRFCDMEEGNKEFVIRSLLKFRREKNYV